MHLAIDALDLAVGANHRRRVVIQARAAPLEKRRDDDDPELAREAAERLRGWSRNRLGQCEQLRVFLAAEILRSKQLLETHDLRAASGRFTRPPEGFFQVLVGIERAAHLHQAHTELLRA